MVQTNSLKSKIIIICGATATGKSDLAIECAKLLDEKGYNEEWFIKEYMELPFFKEMFKRIKKKDEEIQNRILSTGKPVSMKLTRKKETV